MILQASHTHLYPGHRGRISGPKPIAEVSKGCDCLVEFSDGSAANARISKEKNGWQLKTCAYRTRAGTDIPEKRWSIRLEEDGSQPGFRILGRAKSDSDHDRR